MPRATSVCAILTAQPWLAAGDLQLGTTPTPGIIVYCVNLAQVTLIDVNPWPSLMMQFESWLRANAQFAAVLLRRLPFLCAGLAGSRPLVHLTTELTPGVTFAIKDPVVPLVYISQ